MDAGLTTSSIAFLQRLCGYWLTGSTREEKLTIVYGIGGNGKTKFIETVRGCLGHDYATGVAMETLIATHGEQHPTDLADLRGKRLAIATETEEGRRLAESKVKMLTGGDRIRARHMRQDFFEFNPTHKIVIVGNHRPALRNVDEAMRRRVLLIPFDVVIPPNERDPQLAEKLAAERPAILAWMIEGCRPGSRRRPGPARACAGGDRGLPGLSRRDRPMDRGVLRVRPERVRDQGQGVRVLEGMGGGRGRVRGERSPPPRAHRAAPWRRRDQGREGPGSDLHRGRSPVRRTQRTPRPVYGVHARARVTWLYGACVRSVRRLATPNLRCPASTVARAPRG